MKKVLVFSLICVLSGMTLIGCERGVRAGREGETETYQPRPAPMGGEQGTSTTANQQLKGELMRVDQKNQTITVRAENGMEQTFKMNTQTMVRGTDMGQQGDQRGQQQGAQTQNLMGKEGSEVVISWKDDAGAKTATVVEVTHLGTKGKDKTKTQGRY